MAYGMAMSGWGYPVSLYGCVCKRHPVKDECFFLNVTTRSRVQ